MTLPLRLRIKSVEMGVQDARLRMPFKFGIATLTCVPKMTMRLVVEDGGGRRATGYSSDVLPALWFDKAPGKSIAQKVEDPITMAQVAAEEYLRVGSVFQTPFEIWWQSYRAVQEKAAGMGINALTAGFGSSFAERAMIDAACRLAGVSFFRALQDNRLGVEPGLVHSELTTFTIGEILPREPLTELWCRHTVGLGDPLRTADIAPADRLDDGLPQSLEEDIATYGLRYFKIKIDADRERNLARLRAMADLLIVLLPRGYWATLDGNEQVEKLQDVAWLIAELRKTSAGARLVDSILFIEQPLSRDRALTPEIADEVRELSRIRPLIIDESDDGVESLKKARELGYGGISCKNCKGVFKAILNKCLIEKWARLGRDRLFLSSEDLTNVGVVPLQEDLATLAALAIEHSERNGHHYFHGLDMLTPSEQASALAAHPDLYEKKGESVTLRIGGGKIRMGSIHEIGYGYSSVVDFASLPTIEKWRATAEGIS